MKYSCQHSIPSEEYALSKLKNEYRGIDFQRCQFWARGLNDTYFLFDSDEKRYVFRLYRRKWRTSQEIEYELELLDKLWKKGLSISHPYSNSKGKFSFGIKAPEGLRTGALFTDAPGTEPNYTPSISRKYGRIAAQIHKETDKLALKGTRRDIDENQLFYKPMEYVEPMLRLRLKDLDFIRKTGDTLVQQVTDSLEKKKPVWGFCHGDHHDGNAHVDSSGNLTLFDFDLGGNGWRSYDVAVFLWRQRIVHRQTPKAKRKATRNWNGFLEGYHEVRSLAKKELEMIPVFVFLRHIFILGMHAQGGNVWGRNWLSKRYYDNHIDFMREIAKSDNWI